MKNLFLTLTFICLVSFSISAQINTDKQAIDTINWLIENPQIESDSLFVSKSANLIKWQFINHPNSPMIFSGLSEFMDNTPSEYKLYKEISVIYMFSTFTNKIENKNYSEKKSSFYAIQDVLNYYQKALEIDSQVRNEVLDSYLSFSDKELKKKMNKLNN